MTAGRNVVLDNDILTADGNVNITANGSLAMGAGPADSVTAGQGSVIATGRGNIALSAAGDVTTQHLLSSTGVTVTSTNGTVNLARGFGGATFEQGSLTVTAANTVDVNGTIRAGGPVVVSGNDVVLRHSVFTNNQSIKLGRAGGTVTLDPGTDQTSTSVIKDARTQNEVREPPVENGTYTVTVQNNENTVVGATSILSKPREPSDPITIPAVTVLAETRRVTINSGTTGADISFLGEVVGPTGIERTTGGQFVRVDNTSFHPDTPGARNPDLRMSGHYVALDLAAGAGTIRFPSGVSRSAAGTPKAAFDANPNNNQSTAGRTTIDIVVQSASAVAADPAIVFANLFQTPPSTALPGGPFNLIFRTAINIEAFTVRDAGQLQTAGQPPIFPEPNLSAPFDVRSSSLTFGLPVPPFVAADSTAGGAQAEQAVAQSQRVGNQQELEYTIFDGGQGVARSADLGRNSAALGAAQDVFSRPRTLVRTTGRKDTSEDDPYFRRDVFGQPIREDEDRK
jgi:hypothetical protein